MNKIDKKYIAKRRKEMRAKKMARKKAVTMVKVATITAIGAVLTANLVSGAIEGYKWAKENPEAHIWLLENRVEFATQKDRELAEKKIAERKQIEENKKKALGIVE